MNKIETDVAFYFNRLFEIVKDFPIGPVCQCADMIMQAHVDDKQIFVFGNGGSASLASHFANDIGKGSVIDGIRRFRIMCLNDNVSVMTAYANDLGYSSVYVEQLANLMNEGDLVIAISASGNSPNVVRAIEYAKKNGAKTVGWTGMGGGKFVSLVDCLICVKSNIYGPIEDVHCMVNHAIGLSIRTAIHGGFGKETE